jgi:two-component system, OmpR family, phosphate regulon sensor histidine kinase PhoR
MMRSLFSRIFGGYLFVIVLLSALILTFSFSPIRHHYIESLTDGLKNAAISLRMTATSLMLKKQFDELNGLVRSLAKEQSIRITVVDPQGVVVADSEENPQTMENHRGRPEIIEALGGATGRSLRFSSTAQKEMLYIAIPLQSEGRVVGVLRTSLFLSQIEALLFSLKMHILWIAAVIALLSLIAALIFCRSLSRPINDLMAAAQRIGTGDFKVRVFLKKKDEIGRLADTFNYMGEQLEASFSELARQKEELNSIISSLEEGLLVLDRTGEVLRCNESFSRAVGKNLTHGRPYWETFRNAQFSELLERVRRERKGSTDEVELDGRIYLCSMTYLEPGEQIVSVFHDITEAKSLERIKRDFVVNVSHELRTPLTSIKGFTETLEDEVTEEGKRYVDIIRRNTDRLINIVSDLLLLSELEEKGPLQLERLDLGSLAENIARIFDPRLKEKSLALSLEGTTGLPSITADPFKVEQLFVNLLDNAIKYTEKGEIRVAMAANNGHVVIKISDTGIGIPKQDLPRIFERFYVVDKSRSRKFGGTGLGLSIVKHIVLLHNGRIDVESSPGVGTTFTVILPVKQE